MHHDGIPLAPQPLADHRPVLARAVIQHHLGAQLPGTLDLHGRRVGGHDDDGGQAHQRGAVGHPLGVIARRDGDDAAGMARLVDAADLVVGAAELERANPLQRLKFQQHAPAQQLVEPGVLNQRRAQRERADAGVCGADGVNGGRGKHGVHLRVSTCESTDDTWLDSPPLDGEGTRIWFF